jgi:SAM-dependent methyltransferase
MAFFPQSALAHKWLDNLKGIEIGGSAHNSFGLDTINVDRYADMGTIFKKEEIKICGEALKIDVVSHGDTLPFLSKSFDFVINSHVLEHCFDPIKTLKEWARVARRYIFCNIPHRDRTFDSDRELTTFEELVARYVGKIPFDERDIHHSVWDTESFLDMCRRLGYNVIDYLDVDDKCGNSFMVVIQLDWVWEDFLIDKSLKWENFQR